MYKIIFDIKAIEFLEKLEKKIAKRIWNKVQSTKLSPHTYFVRLTQRKDFKLRIGDYRAIADLEQNKKIIQIRKIGHRKNIYNN